MKSKLLNAPKIISILLLGLITIIIGCSNNSHQEELKKFRDEKALTEER